MNCRYCGKPIRKDGLVSRHPRVQGYATVPGADAQADGHPWYCDSEASGEERRHKPCES